MFKRLVLSILILVFGVAMVGMASADTVDMTESECNDADNYWYEDTCYTTENEKLNAQIVSLNDRIDELLGMLEEEEKEEQEEKEQEEQPQQAPPILCEGVSFDRPLKLGTRGEDVKCLQAMLNEKLDEPLAKKGPGSPGNETDYFGPLTKEGVKRFQKKYEQDILAPWNLSRGTGFVGGRTREKLNRFVKRKIEQEQEQEREKEQEDKEDEEQQEQEEQTEEDLTYCDTDDDCTLVNENCCGCENGGGKKCINKEFEESWKSELNCEEKEDIACPMVYLCDDLPSGCECVDNTCQTIE
ncbi:MAG: peptidoglycan-binding domain-containing protein [Candidatus Paceibacterota bacterium]